MAMRQLTDDEIVNLAQEISVTPETREMLRSFAADVYGPAAERIEVVVEYDCYNDEYYEDRVSEVHVFDASGAELDFDLTTEWWRSQEPVAVDRLGRIREYYRTRPEAGGFSEEFHRDEIRQEMVNYRRRKLPACEGTYYVNDINRRSFPVVWGEAREES